jgi:signal transduction histidine kinase
VVAEQACELFSGDAVALYILDESAGLLVPIYSNDPRAAVAVGAPIRVGEGAAGRAMQQRHPLVVDNYQTWEHAFDWALRRDLRSVIAAPLLVADRAIGALVVRFYRPRPARAGEDLERTLELLAAQLAPALEAARLYATSRVERERERALREITQALAANLDERRVLDLAVDYGARLLEAPYARVWLCEPDGHLRCAAAAGFVHDNTFRRRLPADSTSGQASREQVFNLDDAPSSSGWRFNREFGQRTGLGSYLGAGLWRARESLGVIEVMRAIGQRFGAAEELLLISLASAVAVAVSNARAHAEAEVRAAELARSEGQLRQRDSILEAVSFAAERLLGAQDWEPGIDLVLQQLGEAMGVSRVYIVELDRPAPLARYQWTAPDVQPRDDLGQHVPAPLQATGLGRWRQVLKAGQIVHGTITSFPGPEQRVLERLGIRSAVAVPIFAGPDWWGFIGFDDFRVEREWSPGVTDVLRTAAGILGAAIERRRREQERIELAREQSARAEAEAAQGRLAFLAEASQILASSLDYTTTLQSVARLAVPTIADHCTVDLREADGTIRRMATANVDPAAESALRQARTPRPVEPDGPHPVAVALRTGKSLLYPRLTHAALRAFARGPEHHAEILRQTFTSAVVVPLPARAGPIGVITFLGRAGRPAYHEGDLSLTEDLARRCGLAIENAGLYREAREAITIRDEFLSVAAHELKTPLTSLRGYAQLLQREFDKRVPPNPDRVNRAASTIQMQSDKLTRLISQLLDISRIQSGKLAIERRPSDLSQLVRDVVSAARSNLRGHTLEAQVPARVEARVDPLRVEQVLTNLVDNAIKYSPEGGPIEVRLDLVDGVLQLSVRDHGLGVAPEHRPHIFDRFYQAQAGGPLTSMAGMGLGLYISRQIVELHGGSIYAEFPDDGGTRFVVTLPR